MRLKFQPLTCLVWLSLAALPAVGLAAEAPRCVGLESRQVDDDFTATVVDKAWSGTRVRFSGIASHDKIFVGYFDADRWLTVAELGRDLSTACYMRINSRFGGWDSHNGIALALDREGRLHVAGNMHGDPLVYARAEEGGSLEGLRRYKMIGKNEDSVTYPQFMTLRDELLFLYRDGGSGNGRWFVNRWDGAAWTRYLPGALFTNRWRDEPVSAYPSGFVKGPDGAYHVAVVWRRKPDAATNFALSYMKTVDFKNWTSLDGRPLALPLAPSAESLVEEPGQRAGLLNTPKLSLAPDGRPDISYTRYNAAGNNAVFIARPDQVGGQIWQTVEIAAAETRTPVEGRGTLPNTPRFGEFSYDGESNSASIDIGFFGEPIRRYTLAADTLQRLATEKPIAAPEALIDLPGIEGTTQPMKSTIPVIVWPEDANDEPVAALRYMTQRPNNDRKRDCVPEAPQACNPPPSDLTLIERR